MASVGSEGRRPLEAEEDDRVGEVEEEPNVLGDGTQPEDGGGGDSADEDALQDDYEDYSDPGELDPNNPLLASVQEDLFRQLKERDRKLTLALREAEEASKKKKVEREALGVELYSLQQQLVKLQGQAEESVNNLSVLARLREGAESQLEGVRTNYTEAKNRSTALRASLKTFQAQLDTVNATLGQVDLYNDELKAQIAVTRRAAYKAEELVSTLEKEKTRQDRQIDALDKQTRRLEDEKALYETQLVSQRAETAAAAETQREASKEMESIKAEKATLIAQWKTSLMGMSRRDERLQTVEDAVRQQRDTLQSLDGEIAGLKKAVAAEGAVNERLTAVLNKVQTEVRFLKNQVSEVHAKKEKLKADYAEKQKILDQHDSELTAVKAERQYYLESVKGLQKQGDNILNEQLAFEEETKAALTHQVTLEQGAKSSQKGASQVRTILTDLEAALSHAENEKSRIRVDMLNTKAHNAKLDEYLALLLRDLKDQEAIIDKYEVDIRRRNDEIEKKQKAVDVLNKKYDLLQSKLQDENTGPLEATIHNLKKSIATVNQESRDLQNYWLKSQQELVNNEKAASEQSERLMELRSQLAVLQQKRLRLQNFTEAHKAKIRFYEGVVRGHHQELTRLSTLIAKHSSSQSTLAEGNLALESDFMQKLKEAETEALQLEQTIEGVMQEKTFLLGDIIEAERQVMMWEKKIQLARETEAALDPEVGAAEVKEMKKEIHRMQLRYKGIKAKEEKIVAEMKKALVRREHIGSRGRLTAAKAVTESGLALTHAQVSKGLNDLQRKIKQVQQETTASEMELQELVAEQDNVRTQITQTREALTVLRKEEDALRERLDELQWQKALKNEDVKRNQRFSARYEAFAGGKYKFLAQGSVGEESAKALEEGVERHSVRRDQLRAILSSLGDSYSDYSKFMSRLNASTNWKP